LVYCDVSLFLNKILGFNSIPLFNILDLYLVEYKGPFYEALVLYFFIHVLLRGIEIDWNYCGV